MLTERKMFKNNAERKREASRTAARWETSVKLPVQASLHFGLIGKHHILQWKLLSFHTEIL